MPCYAVLCQVLRDQLARRAGPGGEALIPSLQRAQADLQERLIYRSAACTPTSPLNCCWRVYGTATARSFARGDDEHGKHLSGRHHLSLLLHLIP